MGQGTCPRVPVQRLDGGLKSISSCIFGLFPLQLQMTRKCINEVYASVAESADALGSGPSGH